MECLKASHLGYSSVPGFTTIAKDCSYRCLVYSDLSVSPNVPVVPDRVEAVKGTSSFLKAGREFFIQASISTDNSSQILELTDLWDHVIA